MSFPIDRQPDTVRSFAGIFRTPSLDTAITSISNSLKIFNTGSEPSIEEEDDSVRECPRTHSAESAQTISLQECPSEITQSHGVPVLMHPERWLPSSRAMYNFHVGLAAHGESNKSGRSSPPQKSDAPEATITIEPPIKSRRQSDVDVWDQLLE